MMHKIVNGVRVDMTPDEEAEILAEWAANDPAKQPVKIPEPTLEDKVNALLAASDDPKLVAMADDK